MSRLPMPRHECASRKLSTHACWWRGVEPVAQRVRLLAARPADGVVALAVGRGDGHHRAALVREQLRARRPGRCSPARRSCRARCSARPGRRRCRGGSRRPGCPRGRRSRSVHPGSTTCGPRRAGLEHLVVEHAPPSSPSSPPPSSAQHELLGVAGRPARASGVADHDGSSRVGRSRPARPRPAAGSRVYSGRGSSTWGVLATTTSTRQLGPQLDVRAGADRRRRRSAARRRRRRCTPLKKLTLGTMSRRSSPCFASATANRSRAFGCGPCTPPSPYFAAFARDGSTRRRTRRGARWCRRRSVISTRPMSESSSDPAPRYACHCTFTVSATLRRSPRLRGVVHEHVGARVAVEVGEPDHRAPREHPRREPRPGRSRRPTACGRGAPGRRSGRPRRSRRRRAPSAGAPARRAAWARAWSRAATVVLVSGVRRPRSSRSRFASNFDGS